MVSVFLRILFFITLEKQSSSVYPRKHFLAESNIWNQELDIKSGVPLGAKRYELAPKLNKTSKNDLYQP